jgi:ankyrin repeat protein
MEAGLISSIKSGDRRRVRKLLVADPSLVRARDEHGVAIALVALYHGHEELAQELVEAGGDVDAFAAAALGLEGELASLLEGDPDLVARYSPDGFTPLHLAAFFGRSDCVELLLEGGADADAVAKNTMRVTPLHSAAAAGETAIARRLLETGADASARQEGGYTPLHAAAQNGDVELVELLLAHGADAGEATDGGVTSAELAATAGHRELAARLG